MKKELTHRQIQLEELKILMEVDRFCRENGLKYSLCSGTLIGAVRHKGFIPWDDDIDICMPRPDYEKMLEIVEKDKGHIGKFCVKNLRFNNTILPFSKVVNKNILTENEFSGEEEKDPLWIDVFPMDGMPEDEKQAKKFCNRLRNMKKTLLSLTIYDKALRVRSSNMFKYVIKLLCKKIIGKRNAKRIAKKMNEYAQRYDYERSIFVADSVFEYIPSAKLTKKDLEPIEMPFEGKKVYVMQGYDKYLTSQYGNYMTPPAKKDQTTHSFRAYRIGE